jgi:hypothetical protein
MTRGVYMNSSELSGTASVSRCTGSMHVPESEYTRRLLHAQQQLAAIRERHRRLWLYVAIFGLAAIATACVTFSPPLISRLWILLPSAITLKLTQTLGRNAANHGRVQRIVGFYELGLARLNEQWQGRGSPGNEFRPEKHAYASDLDLFGSGSLFELLCTARTGIGRAMLAKWLLNPADCTEIAERQIAVAELRERVNLQEEWASVGGSGLDQGGSSSIREWADAPFVAFPLYTQVLALTMPVSLIVVSILAHVGVFGPMWVWAVVIPVVLEMFLAALLLKRTRLTNSNIGLPSFELTLLVPLFERFEKQDFHCQLLKSLQSRIRSSSRPSTRIRILSWGAWLLDLRQSEYFAMPASLVLWGTNLAILIERWRQRNKESLGVWLEALGQFEALLCLARYYYENPDHTFPILDPQLIALFEADGLGHPLINRRKCVRSDVRLDARGTQLLIVSGSNMSGKSTLLRSIGTNSILALAGGPVSASHLQMSPLQIGCSIAVRDSLIEGKSRFQAEVERLKQILILARHTKVLFLLDEILGGTNSADRFWGASAVIAKLIKRGAIGLATTHDLALTGLVKGLNDRALNVHFEEQFEDGEMRFDYRMRQGVLGRTNGRNVMKALGLEPLDEDR